MSHPVDSSVLSVPTGALMTIEEASTLLCTGRIFSVAGEEELLRALPMGNWIGGTTPYFMSQIGGEMNRERVFVTEFPDPCREPIVSFYDDTSLDRICIDGPSNGFSLLILPAFSAVHSAFARNAPSFEDMYVKPLLGWVCGVPVEELQTRRGVVINGQTMEADCGRAVAMHVSLPEDCIANVNIVNVFDQGNGDRIRFDQSGWSVQDCTVNGKWMNFSEYVQASEIDLRLPLVANYSGAMLNVSIKGIDTERHAVDFYAPVFNDVEYRLASPLGNYERAFEAALKAIDGSGLVWSCNCLFNYLYGELEGKRTGNFTGPITFGEIAYQLLNQTLVYMTFEKRTKAIFDHSVAAATKSGRPTIDGTATK